MQDAVFAAFFIIDHKLHSDLGPVRPVRLGRVCPISNHVAAITLHAMFLLDLLYHKKASKTFNQFLKHLLYYGKVAEVFF